jgi:hypothetical protein
LVASHIEKSDYEPEDISELARKLPLATDTLVVRNGKFVFQIFAVYASA